MTLDQEETEETIGNSLKDKTRKNDLLPNICCFFGRCKTTSTSLLRGRHREHPFYAHIPLKRVNTNLYHEGGDVADDEYFCYLPWVYDRMFCTDV